LENKIYKKSLLKDSPMKLFLILFYSFCANSTFASSKTVQIDASFKVVPIHIQDKGTATADRNFVLIYKFFERRGRLEICGAWDKTYVVNRSTLVRGRLSEDAQVRRDFHFLSREHIPSFLSTARIRIPPMKKVKRASMGGFEFAFVNRPLKHPNSKALVVFAPSEKISAYIGQRARCYNYGIKWNPQFQTEVPFVRIRGNVRVQKLK
jgi:hypothetical protein